MELLMISSPFAMYPLAPPYTASSILPPPIPPPGCVDYVCLVYLVCFESKEQGAWSGEHWLLQTSHRSIANPGSRGKLSTCIPDTHDAEQTPPHPARGPRPS